MSFSSPDPKPVTFSPQINEALSSASTREELTDIFSQIQSEHGKKNALRPLKKTNDKYGKAKGTMFGETPEAESTAVKGMASLVRDNPDLVTSDTLCSHYQVQAKDKAFHKSVVNGPNNPYGFGTTALTHLAPTSLRAWYSYRTSSLPQFSDFGGGKPEDPK